jgi:hypothetical protein
VKEPRASRLLFPITERRFTYDAYARWLDGLAGAVVVSLRELTATEPRERAVVGLRHDVDSRLDNALAIGRLEHARGLRATYFVLHTAPYYEQRAALLDALHTLQDDLGHEIGFHNDLGTLVVLRDADIGAFLHRELAWLRENGIDVRGSAAHGSPFCASLGYDNNYVFAGWDEPVTGRPRTDLGVKLDPADFGLEYEAYHLPYDDYISDSAFGADGRRRHPGDLGPPRPGVRTVALVHPCHWDRSASAKWRRLAGKVVRRAGEALSGRDRAADERH